MSLIDTMLLSTIGTLAGVIVFLYLDKSKEQKTAQVRDDAHAKLQADRDESHVKALREASANFANVINELSSAHQKQEEQIHERHDKAVDEMIREHRREMAGLVDRVLEASRNDKEHDRAVRDKLLALAESLGHRAQWSNRGGRGS